MHVVHYCYVMVLCFYVHVQCGVSCLLDLDDFASVDFVGLVRVVFSSPHQLGLQVFFFNLLSVLVLDLV